MSEIYNASDNTIETRDGRLLATLAPHVTVAEGCRMAELWSGAGEDDPLRVVRACQLLELEWRIHEMGNELATLSGKFNELATLEKIFTELEDAVEGL